MVPGVPDTGPACARPARLLPVPPPDDPAWRDRDAADTAWRSFAAAVAGRPLMRRARVDRATGRADYDRPAVALTAGVPAGPSPAAVLIYDSPDRSAAATRCLVLDLDAKTASPEQVAADTVALLDLFDRIGARAVVDAAVTGGRHVYLPLATRLTLAGAVRLATALRALAPSIDTAPLTNAATGCIRPPGSPHAAYGTFQLLLTPPADVDAAVADPAGIAVLGRLEAEIAAHLPPDPATRPQPLLVTGPDKPRPLIRALPAFAARLARHGPGGGDTYPSPSEARWAVVCAAVRAGLARDDWLALASDPDTWLADNYQARARGLADREWKKACALDGTENTARICDTSPGSTRGGSPGSHGPSHSDLALRRMRTWVLTRAAADRWPVRNRLVALALIVFGHLLDTSDLEGRPVVDAGVRSLAVAAGVSRDSVARALKDLAAAGMVEKIQSARGLRADAWAIRVELAVAHVPAHGTAHGMRAVFRVCGGPTAAAVMEYLESRRPRRGQDSQRGVPVSGRRLAAALGLAPTGVADALAGLVHHGLATRTPAGYTVADNAFQRAEELARQLGAHDLVSAQIERHRRERAAWRARLARHAEPTPSWAGLAGADQASMDELIEDLLRGELAGATVLATTIATSPAEPRGP